MSEHFDLDSVDPQSLYHEDGSVNLEASRALLDALKLALPLDGEQNPLSARTIESTYVTIDLPTTKNEAGSAKDIGEELGLDPVASALFYVAIFEEMEFESPHTPVNEALAADPTTRLELGSELDRHFDYLKDEKRQVYATLEKAQAMLGEPINDVHDLRAIVAIPVAGHQEHKNIYHSLTQFAKQDIDPSEFEVILHVNLPLEDEDESADEHVLATSLDVTLGEVDRFREDYPNISVRYFAQTYKGETPRIGKIRSDLWGTIGYDLKKRGRVEDILVISADADIAHLNQSYVGTMVETFDKSDADIVTANLKWQSAPGLPYDATANRIMRYQTYLDMIRDNHSEFLHTADANTGISLAAYFAVGGYNRLKNLGEMTNLTNRIRSYRSSSDEDYEPVKEVEIKAKGAWLSTNSRRLIRAMALGHSPYHAWNQDLITFGPNDELRTDEAQVDLAEEMAQQNWKKWIKEMTGRYVGDVDTTTKRRLLKAGRRILGFSDLYK